MPTDTKQMDAVVIQASGPPAQSLAYRFAPQRKELSWTSSQSA